MIKLYKKVSEEILLILDSNDIDGIKLVEKFKERQELLDSLRDKELDKFRVSYHEDEIYQIDNDIKLKLRKQMILVKKEISEFKVNKTANSAYDNMSKDNLNIFYKKV